MASRASAVGQGLLALHRYASDHADGARTQGFYLWCQSTGAWQTNKLAMTESDTVSHNDDLHGQRLFGVDPRVDPSGDIVMEAHLKIQIGGGDNIPRLYFYDDVSGSTGQVHVGYIGPHRYVRNTRS